MSGSRETALNLARTTEMSWAAIAREVGEPYTRVYNWGLRAGVTPLRWKRESERREKARRAEEAARERFPELLAEYRAGLLVPYVNLEDARRIVLDVLLVRPAVERLGDGEFDPDLLDHLELLKSEPLSNKNKEE